ncbi:MAG TPA: hypothetical protein VG897_00140 [Terriglobales bacterium]|nr:hypothetical protein [Terriglobales bacterium]
MYWVYDLPNWLFGVLTVATSCAFGVAGVAFTRKWVPSLHHDDLPYNDIVGFFFGSITVLYGIFLGLLMVGVWDTFSDAEAKVDHEAGVLTMLFRDAGGYPEPTRTQIQDLLRQYNKNILEVTWPQQRKGLITAANKTVLDDLGAVLTAYEPKTEGQKILHTEAYNQYNELILARRGRHVSAAAGLSRNMWTLVLAGAAINIAVSWCFHVKILRMHLCMTALLSALLGLMIFLLAAMDHPFRGRVSVSPESFQLVWDRLIRPGAENSMAQPVAPERH